MIKRVAALGLALALILSASACSSLYEKEYTYSEPYTENGGAIDSGAGTEIRNYAQLKSVLSTMISKHSPGGELRFNNYEGSVSDDMAAASYEVRTQTPLGAYAVNSLEYEISRIVSYYTVQLSIDYLRTAEEIAQIKVINGISALKTYLQSVVKDYSPEILLMVYSSTVNADYISALLEDVFMTEESLVAAPQRLQVESYPNEGYNRIYKISLDYGHSRATLEHRTQELQEAAETAAAALEGEDAHRLALSAARYLSAGTAVLPHNQAEGFTTAYHALVEGRADSLGLALAYQALCRPLGIDCRVIKGSFGTMGAEVHYWNILGFDGDYYHMDVSRMADDGEENVLFLRDDVAWGRYMWAYEDYPDCAGPLSYADLFPATEGDEELTEEGGESSAAAVENGVEQKEESSTSSALTPPATEGT